jgi:[methyl-Co(III) methanol-specific corrinoid protein]:coenzyme M methyltransferase
MTQLTSKERVLRLLKKEPVDAMPCFSGQGMVTMPAIQSLGISFPQIHLKAENMAGSAKQSMDMFEFDSVVVPFDMCTIPEAFGLPISIYENSEDLLYPTIPNKWPSPEEVIIPDDYLDRARMPVVDKALDILKEEVGDNKAIGSWILGPFTLAGQIVELDILMKMTLKAKSKVEALLDKLTELIIDLGRHYTVRGAHYMNLREMGTGADLLSPRLFKTMILPRLQKIFDAWNFPKVLHICGSTDLIIEMMAESGADAISVDHKNTLVETRKKIGDNLLLFGDYNGFTLPKNATKEEIKNYIQECINAGVDSVWPGCDIWPDVNEENLLTINRQIKKLGKSPSPAVGRLQ